MVSGSHLSQIEIVILRFILWILMGITFYALQIYRALTVHHNFAQLQNDYFMVVLFLNNRIIASLLSPTDGKRDIQCLH